MRTTEMAGPTHQVQVQVVEAELAQRLAQRVERRFVAVICIPQLSRNEHILPRGARLLKPPTQGPPACLLIRIPGRRVDVPVSGSNGMVHGLFDFTWS